MVLIGYLLTNCSCSEPTGGPQDIEYGPEMTAADFPINGEWTYTFMDSLYQYSSMTGTFVDVIHDTINTDFDTVSYKVTSGSFCSIDGISIYIDFPLFESKTWEGIKNDYYTENYFHTPGGFTGTDVTLGAECEKYYIEYTNAGEDTYNDVWQVKYIYETSSSNSNSFWEINAYYAKAYGLIYSISVHHMSMYSMGYNSTTDQISELRMSDYSEVQK